MYQVKPVHHYDNFVFSKFIPALVKGRKPSSMALSGWRGSEAINLAVVDQVGSETEGLAEVGKNTVVW